MHDAVLQMSINGKRDNFTIHYFEDCARTASMKRASAKRILDDVRAAVSSWERFAADAGGEDGHAGAIAGAQRFDPPAYMTDVHPAAPRTYTSSVT